MASDPAPRDPSPDPPKAGSMDAAAALLDELLLQGVRHLVLSPGSRNAPLAYAAAGLEEQGRIRTHVRIDERSAAFFALGLARAQGRPAAVAMTSGTAVAEAHPAVLEAHHGSVPLLVLSADRPPGMRHSGANQTTLQAGLFGAAPRFSADLPPGMPLRDLRAQARRAIWAAQGKFTGHPGPAHLNLGFDEPLIPHPHAHDEHGGSGNTARPAGSALDVDPAGQAAPFPAAGPPTRVLVVAGDGSGPEAVEYARAVGAPILAEPTAAARWDPRSIPAGRWVAGAFEDRIEQVVVFGRPTLSRPVTSLVSRSDIPVLVVAGSRGDLWFDAGRAAALAVPDFRQLPPTRPVEGWMESWHEAGESADRALSHWLDRPGEALNNLSVARHVWHAGTPEALFIGASNPIRDVAVTATTAVPRPFVVHANRGLAGIDGCLSTASGLATALDVPTRAYVGDLTFLHDVGGLLSGAGERVPDLQLVVLNDQGGGIFSLLEHGQLGRRETYTDTVERYFGTPHQVDIAALAAAYGWEHHRVDGRDAEAGDAGRERLRELLGQPIRGRSIVEVRVDRNRVRDINAQARDVVERAVASAARR